MGSKTNIRLVNITFLNFFARIIFYIFLFAVSFIASRKLSSTDFGELQFISTIINFSWLVFSFGVPTVIGRAITQQFLNNNKPKQKRLLIASAISSLIMIVPGILVIVYSYSITHYSIPIQLVLALLASQFFCNFTQLLGYATYQFKSIFLSNGIAGLMGVSFLLLTIDEYGLLANMYMYLIVNAIIIVYMGIHFIRHQHNEELHQSKPELELPIEWKNMAEQAVFYGVSAILAAIVWQRSEFFVLHPFFGFDQLAIYGIAFTMLSIFLEPLKLIPSVLIHYFAGVKNKFNGSRQFSQFFQHFCWLVIFAGLFVSSHSHYLVTILFTDKYAESAIYLNILLAGMVPGICGYAIMNTLVGMGKSRFLFLQDLFTALLFVLLLFWFAQEANMEGVAWAKTIAVWFSLVTGLMYMHFKLHFHVPYQPLIFSVILASALILTTQEILIGSIFLIVIKAICLFSIYVLISFHFRIINQKMAKRIFQDLWKPFSSFNRNNLNP